jgi:hypothetical protein
MKWLEDQVASIREAATKTLQKIAQVGAGREGWTVHHLSKSSLFARLHM